jgi:hypothetical protein
MRIQGKKEIATRLLTRSQKRKKWHAGCTFSNTAKCCTF